MIANLHNNIDKLSMKDVMEIKRDISFSTKQVSKAEVKEILDNEKTAAI